MKKVLKDTPTQVILWIVTVFIITMCLTSCETEGSGHKLDTTARFRAKEAFYSSTNGEYISFGPMKIIYADSAYRAGDTVRINLDDYVLYEKVN